MSPGYRLTLKQPANHPSLHFGQPIPQLEERNLEMEELGGAGLHGEDFREELVTQWLARRDPFLRPSEQPCTEGSYSCFTSSVLAIRVAVFPFHSNRNHSHTSVSVSCCTQNAKKLLRCFAVRTSDPSTFFLITNLISKMQRIEWYTENSYNFPYPSPTPNCFSF